MTLQEIFDKAAVHLMTQGVKSTDDTTTLCMYRGSNGTMCAAGVFINDEYYSEAFEGKDVFDEGVQEALAQSGFPEDDWKSFELLRDLQKVHDQENTWIWKMALSDVANDYRLDASCLNAF